MPERDFWKDGFVAADFEGTPGNWTPLKHSDAIEACNLANAILRAELEKATRVVCRKDDGKWSCDEHTGFARTTHQGKLVAVQKLEGK